MAGAFAVLAASALRLSLCLNDTPAPPLARVERRLAVMGTALQISVEGGDRAAALEASEGAVREIEAAERNLTTWRPGGPLGRVNTARPGEPVAVGPELSALLSAVLDWSARTDRAFDPTVLPLVRAWDLRGRGRIPDSALLARAIAATGYGRFRIDAARGEVRRLSPEAGIDEGAWGKGYALDRAAGALRQAGVRSALLDLGGQIFVVGRAGIAVADPRDRGRPVASLDVADESISTSGNSERRLVVGGRRIGHLLDPRTGQPARDFGSVTVLARSGLVADILSTAFFVLGPEAGLELSEKLRREGFENRALFLVVAGDRIAPRASPGLQFHLEGE